MGTGTGYSSWSHLTLTEHLAENLNIYFNFHLAPRPCVKQFILRPVDITAPAALCLGPVSGSLSPAPRVSVCRMGVTASGQCPACECEYCPCLCCCCGTTQGSTVPSLQLPPAATAGPGRQPGTERAAGIG